MDGNENVTRFNNSDVPKVEINNSYWAHWNPKDPGLRMMVDPDTLEIRSQYWEHMTLVPILVTLMLAATVFLLVLFRHNPTLVAITVAICLTLIGVYLVITTNNDSKPKYE